MQCHGVFFACCFFVLLVEAWDINNGKDRAACQALTSDPLKGCDPILSLPNNTTPYTILITPGTYTEQVNLTRPGPTYLLGSTSSPKSSSYNTAHLTWAAVAGTTLDNAYTSTLTVSPTLSASLTGSGPSGYAVPSGTPFGCTDFRIYNLNISNAYAPYSATPSLALSLSYSNSGIYNSVIQSYQDTIYIGKLGAFYTAQSTISGQTDFLYGFGTAFITSCTLLLRSCGGGITAWKGSNITFENKYGVYITDSVIRAENSSIADIIKGKCALGRPWNSQMRSVVSKSFLDASILPAGFIDWNPSRYGNLTLQAEFENWGPGWNVTARKEARFGRLLSRGEWEEYNEPKKVFQFPNGTFGNDAWVDYGV